MESQTSCVIIKFMKMHPKAVRILLALISVLYFAAGCLPNSVGAENIAMISMF